MGVDPYFSEKIFKQRSKLPFTINHLNMDGREVSKTGNHNNKEVPSEAPRKHISRASPRPRRSRSSPVRSGVSENNSPERLARSPSASATRIGLPDQILPAPTVLSPHNILYKNNSGPGFGPTAMSFFSPRPPPAPLFIVPLTRNPSTITENRQRIIQSRPQAKTKKKASRRIVGQILESLFKKLPIKSKAASPKAVKIMGPKASRDIKHNDRNRSIAVQALTKHTCNRKTLSGDEDEYSSCKSSEDACPECERSFVWAGSVRALRDSHVRLVLRQLRQLQDIEKLNRALRREHVE
ncbi:uncharacterized protein LOC116777165 isoform X1 [Danaus plexippus]|uniref:uncharacterized protein LOC116777165 isoform X1 n=1 Tax=Danaus plexippus TaxID=13037 RepID=UPI002AB2A3B3|nr:uncharacterized protein LOC116777165 isoform X1 [Danaus plexippus]